MCVSFSGERNFERIERKFKPHIPSLRLLLLSPTVHWGARPFGEA